LLGIKKYTFVTRNYFSARALKKEKISEKVKHITFHFILRNYLSIKLVLLIFVCDNDFAVAFDVNNAFKTSL